MNKHEIIKPLRNGICEVTYTDSHSVEHTLMATMAPQHLPDDVTLIDTESEHTVWAFNVNTEGQENFSIASIIDVEQLTGEGAAINESKLQASPEYMEELDLFSSSYGEDDLDSMEHPEL